MQDNKSIQGYTSPAESRSHKIMVVIGLCLGVLSLVFEFVLVKDAFNHGMWIMFAFIGFGISAVFYIILLKEKEYDSERSSIPS